jgi:protein O-mannosyl-transferase
MNNKEQDLTFKSLFIPFTALKAALIIAFTGVAVFLNSFVNPFVYDDISNIVVSPSIRSLTNIPSFFYSSLTSPVTANFKLLGAYYIPFLYTIYTILYSVFGLNPLPFHLLQTIVHIFVTLLIFLIFSRFFRRAVAFTLSLVFLVHPINSEAVIYIAALQYPLFLLFSLSAFYLLIRWGKILLSFKRLFLVAFLLFLAFLSKDTGVLFVFIILSYTLFFSSKNLKRLIITSALTLALYLLLKIAASFNSLWTLFPSVIERTPLFLRLASIPKIIFYYLSKIILPINFAIGQEWLVKQINFQNFYLPLFFDLLFFSLLGLSGIYIYKKAGNKSFRLYVFFALWFCLGIGAVLQIIPLSVTVADRWFYLPFIGLLGIIGITYSTFLETMMIKKLIINLTFILSIVIIFSLSILTITRNSQWQTSFSLYSHDLQYAGESSTLNSYLGEILVANGKSDQARLYFEKARALNPLGDSLNALAYLSEQQKNYIKAKNLYWQNINLKNGLPKYISYEGLARISLFYEHNPQEAKDLSETALTMYPNDEILIKLLSFSEYFTKDKSEALKTFQKLMKIAPSQENQQIYLMMENDKLTF